MGCSRYCYWSRIAKKVKEKSPRCLRAFVLPEVLAPMRPRRFYRRHFEALFQGTILSVLCESLVPAFFLDLAREFEGVLKRNELYRKKFHRLAMVDVPPRPHAFKKFLFAGFKRNNQIFKVGMESYVNEQAHVVRCSWVIYANDAGLVVHEFPFFWNGSNLDLRYHAVCRYVNFISPCTLFFIHYSPFYFYPHPIPCFAHKV